MDFLIGGIIGLVYGALFALLKHIILWRPLLNGKKEFTQNRLLAAQLISLLANVLALLIVFLMRNILPYSFSVVLITTAFALIITSRLLTMQDNKKLTELQRAESAKSAMSPQLNDESAIDLDMTEEE